MTVKLRVAGDPEEVTAVLAALDAVLEVAYDGRTYPQRGGFGVRAYVEARLPGRAADHGDQANRAGGPVPGRERAAVGDGRRALPGRNADR